MQYTPRERERGRERGGERYRKVLTCWVLCCTPSVSVSVSVFDMQPLILSYVLQCSVFGFGFSVSVSVMVLGSLGWFRVALLAFSFSFFSSTFSYLPSWLGHSWALPPAPTCCFQVLLALTCYCLLVVVAVVVIVFVIICKNLLLPLLSLFPPLSLLCLCAHFVISIRSRVG